MPPKKAGHGAKTQALVPTGPKEVVSHPVTGKQRREYVEKPTTTRALVLRNGKHGAMGTGELFMSNRITGKEKLDLLAEELIEKMKQAVLTPFRLEQCLRIAESKYTEFVDDISDLKDPQLFRYVIEDELVARTPVGTEPRRNATNIAKIVGTRIHNTYMVASAWKIIADSLKNLAREGVTDENIKARLQSDTALRRRYLILYDMVGALVKVFHHRVSVLATTSPYYSKFFKSRPAEYSNPGAEEFVFDLDDKKVRAITSSFLDSIIIELLFPNSKFPEPVLYQLLQDVIQESPNQAKRFTQALWNAIGDLSFGVQLHAIVESALIGPDELAWKKEPRSMPEAYEKWIDAQFVSDKATSDIQNWKDIIFPLVTTRKKDVLDNMWKTINLNYKSYCGFDIDTLWQLKGAFDITPQWSSYWVPGLAGDSDEEEGPDGVPLLTNRKNKNKPLALMATAEGYESDDSMPALQSISNSSEEDLSSDEDSDDDEDYESEDEGYDEEQEDTLRELLREAMDAAHEVDWFENASKAKRSDIDPLKPDERKGNPFMNLLGSLRGRFLNSTSKLKADSKRTEPRRGAYRATPSGAPKQPPTGAPPKPTKGGDGSQKTTMEEVEDEDADVGAGTGPSKKKKKKKNNKKKKTGGAAAAGEEEGAEPTSPVLTPASPTPSAATAAPTTPKKTTAATPASPSVTSASASASTFNIPIETTQGVSGHSYLKQLNETQKAKEKIKTRADHASMFSNQSEEKSGGLFGKVKNAFKPDDNKNAKYTWFSRLGKKGTDCMHQLLRTGEDAGKQPSPMKWEAFVKLMREMGFHYDPSTAGSSVRFDPPNPNDHPISIHKPHPDSTLSPIQIIKIGKRLKRYYGWSEEDFIKQTNAASAAA